MARSRGGGKQLRISIIGAGRLGTALALALRDSGHEIAAVVTRTQKGAARAKRILGGAIPRLTRDTLSDLPPSDVSLIATPDDEIGNSSEDLLKLGIAQRRTVLLTSGALSSQIIQPLKHGGSHVGSLHPLVSVSESRKGAEALRGGYFCVEGDRAATTVARRIVRDLDGKAFSVRTGKKALYHAAAVMSSGHLVALVDLATQMLNECGLTKSEARKVLLPLVQSTVNNLVASEPARALTGTFSRGDRSTVKRHLEALSETRLADALAAYIVLGRHSLIIAKRRADNPAFEKLRKILNAIKTDE